MCRHFKKKRGEVTDCSKCLPEVSPENEDAVEIYSLVHSQAIYVGMEGVAVDLDFSAVQFVMDLNEVENRKDCFYKVITMWRHINNMKNAKRKMDK